MDFSQILLKWYQHNQRDLPWRQSRDPYAIWLSEVILQQTRVEQGMPYWFRFMETFPTVNDLANADEQEVLRLWQGLGYYSRARNLHAAAKMVRDEMGGNFPNNYAEIRSLKGVGDYTAAAIASIAFDLPHAVVDGNVYRFLSRFFGISTPIDSSKGKKEFAELANELLDESAAGQFNQAMMEFGATLCKPANPLCGECPFANQCEAFKNDTISSYPVKEKKTKVRDRYFDFLIITDNKHVLIEQRTAKDIWQGLYQFPLIESQNQNVENEKLIFDFASKFSNKNSLKLLKVSAEYKHLLSHQNLHAKFWWLQVESIELKNQSELNMILWSELDQYGLPQLIIKYLLQEQKS